MGGNGEVGIEWEESILLTKFFWPPRALFSQLEAVDICTRPCYFKI